MTTHLKITTNKVDKTTCQKFGGYLAYWELTRRVTRQFLPLVRVLPLHWRICAYIKLAVKVIWWTLLKPLGCLLTVKTHLRGEYQTSNNIQVYSKEVIRASYWLLYLPFFAYKSTKVEGKKIGEYWA